MRQYIRGTIADRLQARTETMPSGCWHWTGALNSLGYGQLNFEGKRQLTHRLSFQLHVRPLAVGEQVLHHCDNPLCLNPAHLFVGDPAANSKDKVSKNRHARGFSLPHTKLAAGQVDEIRRSTQPQANLASQFGITQSTVSRIKSGKRRPAQKLMLEAA